MHPYEILRRPVVTEKSTKLSEKAKYTFRVPLTANKIQIKEAVELAFKNVEVVDVNTSHMRGKERRVGRHSGVAPDWKKAVVSLKPGQRIEFFDGV
ncbi:MAG: 50S ribosomal protein L23 [Chloroflexota bacterium]|nr:50S ribosomal protein L23 [Chloroflexota bacterium]